MNGDIFGDRIDALHDEGEELSSDMFFDGNERIEEAIRKYHDESNRASLAAVLETIRQRMHEDGHFILPIYKEEGGFAFRVVKSNDDRIWYVAFTSHEEYEKGQSSEVLSFFIDKALKFCVDTEVAGFIINPWGRSFMLTKELIEMMFKADGGVEYSVPDDDITAELLEDGSFLKRAVEICNRNRTKLNLLKLAKILRDSWVWIPCNAIMSEADHEAIEKMIMEAKNGQGLESLADQTFTTQDQTRLVPDILQNGEDYFFPVFTSAEEMGEYGENFSKIESSFLEAAKLARNNEKQVKGIVINAFSEPFLVSWELIRLITFLESSIEEEDEDET